MTFLHHVELGLGYLLLGEGFSDHKIFPWIIKRRNTIVMLCQIFKKTDAHKINAYNCTQKNKNVSHVHFSPVNIAETAW